MFSLPEYRALHEGAGLADRSSLGRFLVTGADRRSYLQGLLTNDIDALRAGQGCYAAYLTPQGRMIADVRLFETGDLLVALVEGSVAADVQARWSTFIFSEDVQIVDLAESTAVLGVYGPDAAALLAAALAEAGAIAEPEASADRLQALPMPGVLSCSVGGGTAYVVTSDDKGVRGFEIVLPADARGAVERHLLELGAVAVADDALEAARIEHGRPRFGLDMTDDTIPLEAGIEARAISQTKGCYVGQEVIIRVLHRGQGRVARRLVGLAFDDPSATPARGDRIRAGDREIGAVTSTAYSPALGRPLALGYVHRDFVEAGTAVAAGAADRSWHARVTTVPVVTPVLERSSEM